MPPERMPSAAELDAITAEQLRERRSGEKWTRYEGAIGAFVAEMDFGTAPAIEQALRDAVDRDAFGYLTEGLVEELRSACAGLYRDRFGWSPPREWIGVVPDVIKAAEVAIEGFSTPGSRVILPTPNYMPFVKLPARLGRESIEAPMVAREGRWELDLEAIDAAFAAGGQTLILCNPANPTGRVYTQAELLALAEVVERHGGRVFSDEIHAPLTYPGHRHVPYASLTEATASHTVTAFSASKAWNVPGLKCAQLLFSNAGDAEHWERIGAGASYGASTLGTIANTAAFREGGPWLEEILEYLTVSRVLLSELVDDLMPGAGCLMPEGTYLAWLDLRQTGLAARTTSPAAYLRREAGVAVTEGAECGKAGQGFVRVNFATPRPILEEALRRIAGAL